MTEYIDRAAVYEKLNNLPHEYRNAEQRARTGGIAACKEIVRYFPAADVVAVVRCADCRCFQCNIRQDENGNLVVPVGVPKFECRWWCAEVSPKDYCSYAKRKKEADNG